MNRSRKSNESRSPTSSKKKTSKRTSGSTTLEALKAVASRIVKGVSESAGATEASEAPGASEAPESATKLLTKQHDEVRALFKRFERARARDQQIQIFTELAHNLVAHDAIEREIFYPACERTMGMTDTLGEALVEHGVVEFSLFQADEARRSNDFEFKCKVLKEVLEHHIKEEEDEFFPRVERAFGKDKLLELGARMKERFEAARASDFRAPLRRNLTQVLDGALKPSGRSAPKSGRRGQASPAPRAKSSKKATSGRRKRAA